jgi:DNA-binding transcriptional ArsR family regulator
VSRSRPDLFRGCRCGAPGQPDEGIIKISACCPEFRYLDSVTELARPLDMSLTAVLQHVQVLEASGLVRSRKAGRTRTCRIDPAVLRSAEAWISQRRATVEQRLDRLDEYLARTAGPPHAAPGRQAPGNTDDEPRENR